MVDLAALFQRALSRRQFLKAGLLTAAGAIVASWLAPTRLLWAARPGGIPTRALGSTGVNVTMLGLGGEGMLRTWGRKRSATRIVQRALDLGITYCDTAPAYSGSQDYYGAVLGERRREIFLASKTHDRTRDGSLRLLEESLKRLKTDHLDLWQLHDLNTIEELDAIFSTRGAIHALEEATQDGRVRFLGVTGHYDPAVLIEALRRYPFDTVLVALNAADRTRLSFIEQLLPMATARRVGIIGMKVLGKGALLRPSGVSTVREALGYVLSLPVSTAIVGFESIEQLEEAVRIAKAFESFSPAEMARVETLARPYADRVNRYKRPT